MHNLWRRGTPALAVATALAAGCGDNTTGVTSAVIAKASLDNGDAQTGPANQLLPNSLRVQVTQGSVPASGITVVWATPSGGSLAPVTTQTADDGSSSSTWTLGPVDGQQSATASLAGGGLNTSVTFTATATGGTPSSTVQVISANAQGGNRFEPANLVVELGTTVKWEWVDQTFAHNVVPDDGSTPPPSGSLTSGPHTYQYTFNTLGVFQYHCQAHGGEGMVGTIHVVVSGN